jgi:hypothetical protein
MAADAVSAVSVGFAVCRTLRTDLQTGTGHIKKENG